MVGFAGHSLPVHYQDGIIAEHLHCRAAAALFDVSHMGQITLHGAGAAAALERLVPADLLGLPPGRQRYSLLLNPAGGVIDDLMIARGPAGNVTDRLRLVVNASRSAVDMAHLAAHLPSDIIMEHHTDRALLALQGPRAATVLARHAPAVAALRFMDVAEIDIAGIAAWVTRSGYTGEDGFEISVHARAVADLAGLLLAEPEVRLAGLGARDSLRLEAGLPLYGQELDEATNPVAAGLAWAIAKRRRTAGDFPGAPAILAELAEGPARRLVGLLPEGRALARAGTPILSTGSEAEIGHVTSGGFGPSVNRPIALGYVRADHAAPGTELLLSVRGRSLPARTAILPFFPHSYAR
jgi:aminomethyltransferase